MSEKVRAALENHLSGMSPALSTGWENRPITPVTGTPYQQAFLLYGTPNNRTMGCDRYTETGIFQITLFYPINLGPGAAQARADAIRDRFKRGTRLSYSGQDAVIPRTPSKTTLGPENDRYRVVVSIPYTAEVFGT